MTPFQWVVGTVLLTLIVVEVVLLTKHLTFARFSLMRASVWVGGLVCLLFPDLLQHLAIQFRIGRGADLLFYAMSISTPIAIFYLLHRVEKQRRQLTSLVRELAIREPVHQPPNDLASRPFPSSDEL